MTSDEFWKDDPQLFVAYRTSFINKKKREMEELDYKCWYQGLYIHNSSNSLISRLIQFLHNEVPDKRKIEGYPVKPYFELEKDKKNKKQIEQDNYKKQNETLICQAGMKQAYLDKIKRQKEKGENNE